MIYTELTKKAAKIACQAHMGMEDKSGWPYIMHPVHLAEQMETEDACVVALLHDVVEDTDITMEDLEREGFTDVQLHALKLLTHDESVPYMDYIRMVRTDPLARTVKLADLDETRIPEMSEKDLKRIRKYREAVKILEG